MKFITFNKDLFTQINKLERENLNYKKENSGFLWREHNISYFNKNDLFLMDEEKLVGFICIREDKDNTFKEDYSPYKIDLNLDNIVLVSTFVVDKQYRGQGIGTKLFKILFNLYKDKQILLEVDSRNLAGTKFYRSMGMKESNIQTFYDNRNWLLFYKDVNN